MEHQQGRAHPGDSFARPEAARVGPATSTVAAADDSTAAAAFPVAREVGDRWYGFRRTRGGGGGAGYERGKHGGRE